MNEKQPNIGEDANESARKAALDRLQPSRTRLLLGVAGLLAAVLALVLILAKGKTTDEIIAVAVESGVAAGTEGLPDKINEGIRQGTTQLASTMEQKAADVAGARAEEVAREHAESIGKEAEQQKQLIEELASATMEARAAAQVAERRASEASRAARLAASAEDVGFLTMRVENLTSAPPSPGYPPEEVEARFTELERTVSQLRDEISELRSALGRARDVNYRSYIVPLRKTTPLSGLPVDVEVGRRSGDTVSSFRVLDRTGAQLYPPSGQAVTLSIGQPIPIEAGGRKLRITPKSILGKLGRDWLDLDVTESRD